ncbi:MAG: TIGR01212 family radical SAM protein [Candidatus Aminicenantaceae bacterium]
MTEHTFSGERYRKFSRHLKEKFGCRVYKITLDAGLSCPNRDGAVGKNGCIFCDPAGGSGRAEEDSRASISRQIQNGMEALKHRYKAEKFIAYFQSFTNTYAPLDQLKRLYDEAAAHPDVVGLSIATRPDCLSIDILDLISGYAGRFYTWIELGVQSIHTSSLKHISRGHGLFAIADAMLAIRRSPIHQCAHLIAGLPGETQEDMRETARTVSRLGADAVKFHMLYVTRGSRLLREYQKGRLPLMTREEYVNTVVMLLENLSPEILIQRLTSDAHPDILAAPEWLADKSRIIRSIENTLVKKDTWQGRKYQSLSPPPG